MRILTPAALGLLTAVALTACGGSGGSAGSSAGPTATQAAKATQGTVTSTTTATATASAGTSATTPTTGTATGSDGGAGIGAPGNGCKAAGLAVSYLGGQGATGHGELGFLLKNTGSACSSGGYPGIQFLDRGGAPLPTTPDHTTSDFFGHLPLRPISLGPGQTVSFRLGVSHSGGSGAACATAYGLQVIAPNDTATLRVQIPNGASECGATTVSPLQPGDSAYR
jgi:uncharacterized protein DUF4232